MLASLSSTLEQMEIFEQKNIFGGLRIPKNKRYIGL